MSKLADFMDNDDQGTLFIGRYSREAPSLWNIKLSEIPKY